MIIFGQDALVAEWVSLQLFGQHNSFHPCVALGVAKDNKIIAGVVYNNYQTDKNGNPLLIEMTIASVDKRWATRHNLKVLFSYPFAQLKLERVQALCSANNEGVQMFLEKLGFTKEGLHRKAYADGGDCISYGMLKNECRWL